MSKTKNFILKLFSATNYNDSVRSENTEGITITDLSPFAVVELTEKIKKILEEYV